MGFDMRKDLIEAISPEPYITYLFKIHGIPDIVSTAFTSIVLSSIKLFSQLEAWEKNDSEVRKSIKEVQEKILYYYDEISEFSRRDLPEVDRYKMLKIKDFPWLAPGGDALDQTIIIIKAIIERYPLNLIFPSSTNTDTLFLDVIKRSIRLYIHQRNQHDYAKYGFTEAFTKEITKEANALKIDIDYFLHTLRGIVEFPKFQTQEHLK